MTGVLNSLREESCWNYSGKDHWMHQCLQLSEEEMTELAAPGGPSLLNVTFLDKDVYAAKDKYDGVVFFLPVMVRRKILNPHYLYLTAAWLLAKFSLTTTSQTLRILGFPWLDVTLAQVNLTSKG